MKPLLSVLFLSAWLFSSLSPAPALPTPGTIDTASIDTAITAQMKKHGFPGVSLAIVQGDEIIYAQGYGTAGDGPMTSGTQMFIGSLSKSFTALAIAQLAEAGRLDLDAPVQAYIPWFKVDSEEASRQITAAHLLHHTSGLAEAGFSVLLPNNASLEEAVRALAHARQVAPVGSRHMYFNYGYDVLAYLIETITGESYAGYIQENILDPLGMASTTADPARANNVAQGYTRLFGFAVPRAQPVRTYEIGAGYIVSTAEDLARYAIAMKNGGQYSAGRLVSAGMARTMFHPGLGGYGFGWNISTSSGKIWHGGANETFRTDLNIYPRQDRALVLLVNQGHLIDHYVSTSQLLGAVEALVLGQPPLPVEAGWSVRQMGWALGGVVLALAVLHSWNFYHLFHGWRSRFGKMPRVKKWMDVSISFIIPTAILLLVFSQMQAFFGYRYNLISNLALMHYSLPDIFILMVAGILPDYLQGFIKLYWIMRAQLTSSPLARVVPVSET